jgi:hypothetical protein
MEEQERKGLEEKSNLLKDLGDNLCDIFLLN